MQTITSIDTLHEAIVALESRRREQEQQLTSHFMLIYDSLKPVNIIKNTIRDLAKSPGVQHPILNAAMGMVSGYLSRKLFIRSQSGPLKKVLGAVLQFGITNLVRIKGNAIRAGGLQLVRNLRVNRHDNGSR